MSSTSNPAAPAPQPKVLESHGWAASLADAWFAWRDGKLASPTFQRWAAGFAPTRFIARRRARGLFDLVAGFVYSQVLLAAVRLRLFDILAEGPQTLAALAPRLGLAEDEAQRLLAAAASLKLVQRRSGGRYGLGSLGAPMVGNTAVAAMVEHHATLYADLRDPVALLRREAANAAMAQYWPYAVADAPGTLGPERVAEYSALMSASQPLVADQVIDAYPFSPPPPLARRRRRRGHLPAPRGRTRARAATDVVRPAGRGRPGPRTLRTGRARGALPARTVAAFSTTPCRSVPTS